MPVKHATNLSLSGDVLDAAKRLGINISQVCDNHLREVVRHEQERRWREDHADFIAAYNATIEADGLPLDEWRSFLMARFDVDTNPGASFSMHWIKRDRTGQFPTIPRPRPLPGGHAANPAGPRLGGLCQATPGGPAQVLTTWRATPTGSPSPTNVSSAASTIRYRSG
jgi:antitoxin CcdA